LHYLVCFVGYPKPEWIKPQKSFAEAIKNFLKVRHSLNLEPKNSSKKGTKKRIAGDSSYTFTFRDHNREKRLVIQQVTLPIRYLGFKCSNNFGMSSKFSFGIY
jgi:hypothetical protein